MAWYVGVLGGLEWFRQTSGIPAISADLSTPLATRCDRYDSALKLRGGVKIIIILSATPPYACLCQDQVHGWCFDGHQQASNVDDFGLAVHPLPCPVTSLSYFSHLK